MGALADDENGDEILIGLTVAESDFFLMFQERLGTTDWFHKAHRFHELMERHLLARQLFLR